MISSSSIMPQAKDGILIGTVHLDPAAVELKDGKSSSRIQVAKTGQRFKWVTRTFDLTEENFDRMVENFARTTTKPCIDYNHLSMSAMIPDQAIAAGWFVSLEREGQKLFGTVDWTPKAAKHIADKEYQYISPTITPKGTDEQGNDIGHLLLSAAITNYPFLKDMEPVSLSELRNNGLLLADFSFDEKRSRLTQALTEKFASPYSYIDFLDLFDDYLIFRRDGKLWKMDYSISSKGDVKFKSDPSEAVAQYATLSITPPARIQMPEDIKNHPDFVALSSQLATLSTTVDSLKTAGDKSANDAKEQKERADRLELELKTAKANTAVMTLIRAGKVAKASQEQMVALYLKDETMFTALTATLPQLVKVDGETYGGGDAPPPAQGKDPQVIMLDEIKKYQDTHGGPEKVPYSEALRAVTTEKPELAEAYRASFAGESGESIVN